MIVTSRVRGSHEWEDHMSLNRVSRGFTRRGRNKDTKPISWIQVCRARSTLVSLLGGRWGERAQGRINPASALTCTALSTSTSVYSNNFLQWHAGVAWHHSRVGTTASHHALHPQRVQISVPLIYSSSGFSGRGKTVLALFWQLKGINSRMWHQQQDG